MKIIANSPASLHSHCFGLWFPLSLDCNYGPGNFPAKICYGFAERGYRCVNRVILCRSREA
jgi:hypothetical protein